MTARLEGRLHVYSVSNGSLTIFESGDCSSSSALLFIGGLTEVNADHDEACQLMPRDSWLLRMSRGSLPS